MGKASQKKSKQRSQQQERLWTPWQINHAMSNEEDGVCLVNNLYTVYGFVDDNVAGLVIGGKEVKEIVHLSIKSHDRKPVLDWRDKLRIKNELCGEDAEAVELYPAMNRVVDMANQFHLWVIGSTAGPSGIELTTVGMSWPFGFDHGGTLVQDQHEGVRAMIDIVGYGAKLKQRKLPEWMKSKKQLAQSIVESRSDLMKEPN